MQSANAQEAPLCSPTSGPDSPFEEERNDARRAQSEPDRLAQCREALKQGKRSVEIIEALAVLGARREKSDIELIAPYIAHIEPDVSQAAMLALRGFGKDALPTVEALSAAVIDAPTRKKVREQLLKDHIYACCQRDKFANPYQIDYEGRIDELYSINSEIDTLMLNLFRDALPEIRQDLAGVYYNRRYYYYGVPTVWEPQFIEYGALVVAALAKRQPEVFKRETQELTEIGKDTRYYYGYYGWQVRQPVTQELCFYFARHGKVEPLLQMISDLEATTRWNSDSVTMASVNVEIASCMMAAGISDKRKGAGGAVRADGAKGPFDATTVLERLDAAVLQAGPSGQPVASHARYFRARLLMIQGDDGGALRELEESMEASENPMLLVLVDSLFRPLAGERRFQTVLSYAELISRRVSESARPYRVR